MPGIHLSTVRGFLFSICSLLSSISGDLAYLSYLCFCGRIIPEGMNKSSAA